MTPFLSPNDICRSPSGWQYQLQLIILSFPFLSFFFFFFFLCLFYYLCYAMAANFWVSTQRRHWLFSREQLAEAREKLKEKDRVAYSQFPLPDQRFLNIYFDQREIKDH